ncbi:MAG: diacylglycerol/lipid kinase family protein [Armatimonadota bacterium]
MLGAGELERIIRRERAAALIVNTHSRRGARLYERARVKLRERGLAVSAYPISDPGHLPSVVRQVIQQGHHLVILGGGDGTISSLVGEFAYRDVVLGVLPLGTENSFARTLDIPLKLADAIEIIIAGHVQSVDLGRVNDDYFANAVAVGLSADAIRGTSNRLKRLFGKFAYIVVGINALLSHHAFLCRLTNGHLRETLRTHEVVAMNGRYFGETAIDDSAGIDDATLTVCVMEALNHWQVTKQSLLFLLGFNRLPGIRCFTVDALHIDTDPRQRVDIDGEVTERTPVQLSIAPKALLVLVP